MTASTSPWHAVPATIGFRALRTLLVAVMVSGCGGDAGDASEATTTDYTLHVAVVNDSLHEIEIALDSGSQTSEPTTLGHCLSTRLDLTIPADHWTLTVNDEVAIDSAQLAADLVDQNLEAMFIVNADDTLTQDRLAVGDSLINPGMAC